MWAEKSRRWTGQDMSYPARAAAEYPTKDRGSGLKAKHGEHVTLTFPWYHVKEHPNTHTQNDSRKQLILGPKSLGFFCSMAII